MKVILREDVENLGVTGDIVTVKDGFGRNYLIPKGLALLATESATRRHNEEVRQAARKSAKMMEDATALASEIEKSEVTIAVKVGEENRIFGTVTTQQVSNALSKQGFEIDRRTISINEEIRVVGVYTASIRIHRDVTAQLKVRVEAIKEGEEE